MTKMLINPDIVAQLPPNVLLVMLLKSRSREPRRTLFFFKNKFCLIKGERGREKKKRRKEEEERRIRGEKDQERKIRECT